MFVEASVSGIALSAVQRGPAGTQPRGTGPHHKDHIGKKAPFSTPKHANLDLKRPFQRPTGVAYVP